MTSRLDRRAARERKQRKAPLPMVGGPLDGETHPAKENPAAKIRQQGWSGEYRRVGNTWRWWEPHGAMNGTTDRINVARLPSHPSSTVMANHAADVSKRIRAEGTQATRRATVLAARGISASTGSGSRSADPTTPVERAAGLNGDDGDPTPSDPKLIDLDRRLAQAHRDYWRQGLHLLELYDLIASHASDDDPIPAGTGSCRRCNTFCRPGPDKPNNRIMAGYCPTCHRAWHRADRPDKTSFDRSYRPEVARS